ncbi:MAG TPA: hypothetical protein VF777_03105 [Phycisphaerales bacterium]
MLPQLLTLSVVGVLAAPAAAGFSYAESVNGDLSDDRLAPSQLMASYGSNILSGSIGKGPLPGSLDLDYVTVTIPAGMQLARLDLVQANVGGAVSFIAVEAGAQISVPHTTVDASPLLGWHHFGGAEQGSDILQAIGAGPGAIGFAGPLGPGQYTFWVMELNTAEARGYSFEFVVVPAPSSACLAALGGLIAAGRRRGAMLFN